MGKPAKPDRNSQLAQEYRQGGVTMRELSERHGIAISRVQRILKREDALVSPAERRARQRRGFLAFLADPVRSAPAREKWREAAALNRPATVWPDCPEELRADYETLRQVYPARVAKAKLLGRVA